jgi:hypothetical protein
LGSHRKGSADSLIPVDKNDLPVDVRVLHGGAAFSEPEAYLRIGAARAARKHPMLLSMLGDGRLRLSGIAILAPHLTDENRERVLARAGYKSKRQIEELVTELAPKADVAATVRKLSERADPAPTPQLFPDRVTFLHTQPPVLPKPPAPASKPAEVSKGFQPAP